MKVGEVVVVLLAHAPDKMFLSGRVIRIGIHQRTVSILLQESSPALGLRGDRIIFEEWEDTDGIKRHSFLNRVDGGGIGKRGSINRLLNISFFVGGWKN